MEMFMIEVKIMWTKISYGSQGRPYIDFDPSSTCSWKENLHVIMGLPSR